MNEKLEKRRLSSEIFKNYMTALAVIAAGLWAVFQFCQKEVPKLRTMMGTDLSISWQKIAGRCVADVMAQIRNDSGAFVEVNEVKLEGWNFANSNYVNDGKAYLDPTKFKDAVVLQARPCNRKQTCTLVGSYAPGAYRYETFTWSFEPNPARSIFIKATVDADNHPFHAEQRSMMCGESAE